MRLNKIDSKDVRALSAYLESREAGVDQQMNAKVLDIIEQVRTRTDDALLEYTEKFDHVKLDSLIMSEEEIEAGLYAIVACKAAIKAGDVLDDQSATALLEKVFELDDPSCPHGRTFVIRLSEKELRLMVGRTK